MTSTSRSSPRSASESPNSADGEGGASFFGGRHAQAALRLLVPAAWLLGALMVAGALLVEGWEARRFVLFYLAPLVPAVVLWVRERLLHAGGNGRAAAALDAGVVVLAALRTVTGALPFSGHMLFLTHGLLTVRSRPLVAYLLLLWLETAYFKLVLWSDPHSWGIGLLLGLLTGGLHARLRRRAA